MKTKLVVGIVLGILVLGACSGRDYPDEMGASSEPVADYERGKLQMAELVQAAPPMVPAEASVAADEMTASDAAGKPGSGTPGGLAVLAASKPDRYLIKNATVMIETEDARAATNQLMAALEPVGGYVSNLNESVNSVGKRTVTVQVRIPSDSFDQSMMQVEALGKVLNKQVTTQDVTEQFVDTDARVRNLRKTEERLLEHLSRAGVLEEVLRMEEELSRVRENIERMEGQLRFLTDRVSFSTISITLQETAKAEPIVPAQSFSTAKVFSEAVRSLVGFGQVLWTRVIWVAVWLPVWIVPVLVLALLYRRYRRHA